jgi:hypothetical protein
MIRIGVVVVVVVIITPWIAMIVGIGGTMRMCENVNALPRRDNNIAASIDRNHDRLTRR